MFYDVPDCLSANSGIESLYLKAAGQLADKGSYIGAREMIVRFLNSESLLDLDLSEDFIRDELADYFSPKSDFAGNATVDCGLGYSKDYGIIKEELAVPTSVTEAISSIQQCLKLIRLKGVKYF